MRTSAHPIGTVAVFIVLLSPTTGSRADDMYEMRSALSPRVQAAERLRLSAEGEKPR